MTIQQLKYIIALDNHRHYVNAAAACFVTQPTLTIQVKKLEEEINTLIFDREKNPLEPTIIGEILIAKAKTILREVNEFKEFVNADKDTLFGEYTLGIIPTIAPYLLPFFLKDFLKTNPKVTLIINEMKTSEIIEGLHKGTLDIGILSTPLEDNSIREINLYQEPFLVYYKNEAVFTPQGKINQDDLTTEDLLLLEEGHCFRNQVLNICAKDTNHKRNGFLFESGSIQTIKGLVKAGLGYSLVPQLSILEPDESAYIKEFEDPRPTREVSLVVHKRFTKEKMIENLLLSIKKGIPKGVREIDNYIKVRWK